MRIPYPHRYPNEAEAVVGEARALERETIAETEWLVRYLSEDAGEEDDGGEDLGPWGPDYGQYVRLREAAADVAGIAWDMQNPASVSPYAGLGEDIIAEARNVLTTIRDYRPWAPLKDPKA